MQSLAQVKWYGLVKIFLNVVNIGFNINGGVSGTLIKILCSSDEF